MEAPSTSTYFREMSTFKVQINFDIPLFEGKMGVEAMEGCFNQLKSHFFVHNSSNNEKITFTLPKSLPRVKHWWDTH